MNAPEIKEKNMSTGNNAEIEKISIPDFILPHHIAGRLVSLSCTSASASHSKLYLISCMCNSCNLGVYNMIMQSQDFYQTVVQGLLTNRIFHAI